MRYLKTSLAFLILIFSLSSAIAEHPIHPTFFSMQAHSFQVGTDTHLRSMDLMTAANITIMRDEMWWWNVEKEKGKIVIPDSYYKNVDITVARGLKIMLILDYANKFWDNDKSPYTDEGRQAFARYCYTMVSTFKGKIDYFEIWNEPNGAGFWSPVPNPKDYALLLKEAYAACKKANPDCIVIGGVTSGVDIDFLEKVFANDGYKYMDVLSVHPYRQEAPETGNTMRMQLQRAKDLMQKYHKPMRLWLTEMGYPTHIGSNGHSEDEQANYIARCYLEALSTGWVDSFFWYWFGPDGPDEKYSEDRFGLLHSDFSPKPSYFAYKTLSGLLTEGTFLGTLDLNDANLRAYEFRSKQYPGKVVTALWNIRESKPVSFQVTDPTVVIIQRNGEKITLAPLKNNFSLVASQSPVYIITGKSLIPAKRLLLYFDSPMIYTAPGGVRNLKLHVDKSLAGTRGVIRLKGMGLDPSQINLESLKPNHPIFSSGTTIKFTVPKTIQPEFTSIRAELYNHDVLTGYTEAGLQFTSHLKTWIRPRISKKSQPNEVVIKMVNQSNETIKTKINLTFEGQESKPYLSEMQCGPFASGATVQRYYTIAGTTRMDDVQRIQAVLETPGYDTLTINRQIDFFPCYKTRNPIDIDGSLAEWNRTAPMHIYRKDQLTTGKDNYRGEKDFDAKVYLCWDEKNLYIAAEVIDDIYSQPPKKQTDGYRYDGLELYLDTALNGDLGDKKYDENDYQFGFFDSKEGPYAWCWPKGDGEVKTAKVVFTPFQNGGGNKDSKGYILEGMIPLSFMKFNPIPGQWVGMTVSIDDDDTPETINPFLQDKQFTWAGDAYNYADPSHFGFMYFSNPLK